MTKESIIAMVVIPILIALTIFTGAMYGGYLKELKVQSALQKQYTCSCECDGKEVFNSFPLPDIISLPDWKELYKE